MLQKHLDFNTYPMENCADVSFLFSQIQSLSSNLEIASSHLAILVAKRALNQRYVNATHLKKGMFTVCAIVVSFMIMTQRYGCAMNGMFVMT